MKVISTKREAELAELLTRLRGFDDESMLVLQKCASATMSVAGVIEGVAALAAAVESLKLRVEALESGRKVLN